MRRKYKELVLADEQPESTAKNFFRRMAIGDRFNFIFIESSDPDRQDTKPADHEIPLSVKILSVETIILHHEIIWLRLEIDTNGEVVPPGIKHGRYILDFDIELICDCLPDEMFEE
jgi:hypothetical protein